MLIYTQKSFTFAIKNMQLCTVCNKQKEESSFRKETYKRKDGSLCQRIRKQCIECRNEIQSERIKDRRKNDKSFVEKLRGYAKERYKILITESESFIKSKKKSDLKQREKRKQSKYHTNYRKTKGLELRIQRSIGAQCELHIINCFVCQSLIASKSNIAKKCNNCKSVKLRKKTKPFLLHDFICCDCNLPYQSTKANKGKCKACIKKSGRNPNRNNKTRDHIQRAKKKGVVYERINPESIYKRDGYRCKSCSCIVVKSKTYQPNQATIDHVIPISKGGSHTIDNVVTMCMSCNSKKSAKVIQGTQIGIFCAVNDY